LETQFLVSVNKHVLEGPVILQTIKPTDNVYSHVQPHQCKLMDWTVNVFLTVLHQHGLTLSIRTESAQHHALIHQEEPKVTDTTQQENAFQFVQTLNSGR